MGVCLMGSFFFGFLLHLTFFLLNARGCCVTGALSAYLFRWVSALSEQAFLTCALPYVSSGVCLPTPAYQYFGLSDTKDVGCRKAMTPVALNVLPLISYIHIVDSKMRQLLALPIDISINKKLLRKRRTLKRKTFSPHEQIIQIKVRTWNITYLFNLFFPSNFSVANQCAGGLYSDFKF